jgi:hypothetical protein
MRDPDLTVASFSQDLANRLSRRSFFGRLAKVGMVMAVGSGSSVLLTREAAATHRNVSVECAQHPDVGYNGCPSQYCDGGCWSVCDNGHEDHKCGCKVTVWCDCCSDCNDGCRTVSDSSDPNGAGYTCCFEGYCDSGCSGKKNLCRWWYCTDPNACC